MTVSTRLLPDAAGSQLRAQWAETRIALPPPDSRVVLLRTIAEDPLGRNHLVRLDAALEGQMELIARAWADAQLAADTTWLGLGIGVRLALVPLAGQFQVVLIEIKTRRQIAVGGRSRSPLLALRRARRRLVSAVDPRGSIPRPFSSRLRLVGRDHASKRRISS